MNMIWGFFSIILILLITFLFYIFSKKLKIKQDFYEKKQLNSSFLHHLKKGQNAIIESISESCDISLRNRLLDLGFVKGSKVSLYLSGPLKNPKAYFIQNTAIVLRNEQAQYILISIIDE